MDATTQNKLVKRILDTLSRQKFADFYNGDFEKFITGDYDFQDTPPAEFEKEIKEQIKQIFQLETL